MTARRSALLATLLFSACALGRAQAPSGSTGQCKDGTYTNAASKSGACRGHQGVQTWYAAPSAGGKPATAAATPKTPAAPAPASKPAPAAKSAPAASSQAPAGATGQCKDGTYSNAASKSGACRGHQGVQTWYAAAGTPAKPAAPSAAPAAPAPPPASAAASRPAAPPAPAPAAAPAPRPATPVKAAAAQTPPAAGGGNGQVWVNTETKVYHCSGDRYYGKTKQGAYMSQSDAQAKGFRPDAGKPCPQ